MKYPFLFLLLFPVQICLGQFFGAMNQGTFTASGDAILRIPPDQVVLSLGVETKGKELVETKEKNYSIMDRAIGYCKAQGVKEKYIQTDYIRIQPHYTHSNQVNVDYYSVVQSVSIVLEDLTKYEQILTELLNIGINKVNNIEFRTTKLKENRYKVRKMAIEAAKEKAQFLTEEVGIELGEIINIGERVDTPVNSFSMRNYANTAQNLVQDFSNVSDNGTLSIGMLSLKATITLIYEIK